MYRTQPSYYINCSVDDLMKDIKSTTDPLRKIILQRFLDIKIRELRVKQEDRQNEKEGRQSIQSMKYEKNKKELDAIIRKQSESLTQLDKQSKMKAYTEIIADNQRESEQKTLEKIRGKAERVWGVTYDPRY